MICSFILFRECDCNAGFFDQRMVIVRGPRNASGQRENVIRGMERFQKIIGQPESCLNLSLKSRMIGP